MRKNRRCHEYVQREVRVPSIHVRMMSCCQQNKTPQFDGCVFQAETEALDSKLVYDHVTSGGCVDKGRTVVRDLNNVILVIKTPGFT